MQLVGPWKCIYKIQFQIAVLQKCYGIRETALILNCLIRQDNVTKYYDFS
jgi:hypothetical protein